jgi:DNA-binding NtrC family response regulator
MLILDLDPFNGLGSSLRGMLESAFRAGGQLTYRVCDSSASAAGADCLSGVGAGARPSLVFVVLPSCAEVGGLVQAVKRELPETLTIALLDAVEPHEVFELLRLGVADFITPPLREIDILPRVWRLLKHTQEAETLTQSLKGKLRLKQLVGVSPSLLAEVRKIPLIARCDARTLIKGETGTGKELFARAIHYLSPRAGKPFIPVNCGALPPELIENELFGHERGAFTGANTARPGLIHEAEGGTLFLDEVDCLPLVAQVKFLRFLQESEYRPLGSAKTHQSDVRIIAATNADLERATSEGRLRQDLYYRLDILSLEIPPLRARREDVPHLARHFLSKYAAQFGQQVHDISPEAMLRLVQHDWPGNIRELEHVIQRAVLLCEDSLIRSADLKLAASRPASRAESFKEAKEKYVSQFERQYIQDLLRLYQGNITQAAQAARKNRRAFWQLIRKHCIDAQSFKPHTT